MYFLFSDFIWYAEEMIDAIIVFLLFTNLKVDHFLLIARQYDHWKMYCITINLSLVSPLKSVFLEFSDIYK